MIAVLINKAGLHKHLHAEKRVSSYRQFDNQKISTVPWYEADPTEQIPVIEFVFRREYEDEWGEIFCIYEEYGL